MATGRFQEAEFHWQLSGHVFEARTVAIRPKADIGQLPIQQMKPATEACDVVTPSGLTLLVLRLVLQNLKYLHAPR